jgi:hypothetical protein
MPTVPSLTELARQCLAQLPGYECLDETLANVLEGRRGDYLFRDRGIIIEQKEFRSDRRGKIEELFRESEALLRKYDPENTWLWTYLTHGMGREAADVAERVSGTWLPEDRHKLRSMIYSAARFVEPDLSSANKQIESTRNLLHIPHARGLALFINEQAGYFHPLHLVACIQRLLAQVPDKRPRFPYVDGVLLFQKLQGFTIEGRGGVTLYMPGPSENKAVEEFAKEVATAFPPGKQTVIRHDLLLVPDHMCRSMIRQVRVRIYPVEY